MANDNYNGRIGNLEISVGTINEKLGNTSNILNRMQDTLEQQTELMSKVLLIQEKQETFKISSDKLQELVTSIDKRVDSIDNNHSYFRGWMAGVGLVIGGLMIILSFAVKQNVDRLDKMEGDYYKPSPVVEITNRK